jgi:hypothetical protein
MIVRKAYGENKVGRVIVSRTEVALAHRMGIPIEKYIKTQLVKIAKQRKWFWYFDREKSNA